MNVLETQSQQKHQVNHLTEPDPNCDFLIKRKPLEVLKELPIQQDLKTLLKLMAESGQNLGSGTAYRILKVVKKLSQSEDYNFPEFFLIVRLKKDQIKGAEEILVHLETFANWLENELKRTIEALKQLPKDSQRSIGYGECSSVAKYLARVETNSPDDMGYGQFLYCEDDNQNYPINDVCNNTNDPENLGKRREEIVSLNISGLNIDSRILMGDLYLKGFGKLKKLDCSFNYGLTNVNEKNLEFLNCSNNPINNLTLNNSPNLISFDCFGPKLAIFYPTSTALATTTIYANDPVLVGSTIAEITQPYFRTDLPQLTVGDKIEVITKNFDPREKNEKPKYRLTHFKGTVIAQKNPKRISYTLSVLKESSRINRPVRRAKLYFLERETARKKDNEKEYQRKLMAQKRVRKKVEQRVQQVMANLEKFFEKILIQNRLQKEFRLPLTLRAVRK
ncbi:16701_t:CDS:10 [Gigaspora margarita]|uniref:16701_t:CDS:1 n=1 Tax=Gigaspora margarita TaxID=4874 RepID=A0ABN7VYD0_GIGMA|nr:16701_t:CDS:10 [Gigaspora margarita]